MINTKKFTIRKKIINDAPFGNINYFSISFLDPRKIDDLKYLNFWGFKVYNGYNTVEIGNEDAKTIKSKNENHNIFIGQMGKLCAWDDVTKTDCVEYNDEKLNDMEKTRKENIDKMKLLNEQLINEKTNKSKNNNFSASRKRMQKKLYAKGRLTKKEYDFLTESRSSMTVKEMREKQESLSKIKEEAEKCSHIDYLDENEPIAFKFGCISIFSPKQIGGLKTICFKLRGLFETQEQMFKKIDKLKTLYPDDPICYFELGKWNVYSEDPADDQNDLIKLLNYSMKRHLENVLKENEEFEKRKESLQKGAEQQSKQVDKKSRRKINSRTRQKKPNPLEPTHNLNDVSFGNKEDDDAINNLINFLDDPELRDKYKADTEKLKTIAMNLNK